jgi:hypothetical protein
MKALPSFSRNDAIRAIALVSVLAFPLIADAQLVRPLKTSNAISPAASAVPKTPIVSRDCAAEHWPFFSKECLRGSAEVIQPRLVSMSAESSPNSAAPDDFSRRAATTDAAQADALIATKSKKPAKPRVASHRRERRNASVNYAVNSETGQTSIAGW